MKKNEIKKTIEQVVRVEYIAEDGTIFRTEEECQKYEESALFAVNKKLKRLNIDGTSIYDFNECGSEEECLEVFDIQTEEDLTNLRRYLYLKLSKNGANKATINSLFTAEGEHRKDFVFDNITIGHEVMIFWSYDCDWAWTYNDGSLGGYFSWLRKKYNNIIIPAENKTKSE